MTSRDFFQSWLRTIPKFVAIKTATKLILPDPITLKGTARVSSLLVFEDERLAEYSNEIE